MTDTKNKPFARHFHRIRPKAAAPVSGYYPDQVCAAYGFPNGVNASGPTVGIIELGGSNYASDLTTFCQARKLPVPSVTPVLVNGAAIQPDPGNADVEVMLDIEMVASAFPGCTIKIFYCNNTETDFIAGVQQALAACDALSCSWGAPEDQWSDSGLQAMNAAIAANPTPFMAASGDSGSTDGESGKHVDFPASAQYSFACGGTTLPSSNGSPSIAAETAWSDSGGGISSSFSKPAYQAGEMLSGSKRGTPDVAACADPNTPYNIYCNGQWMQVGGTSAVAPLMAGLFAALKAEAKVLPSDMHSVLYAAGTCRDITSGSNGSFKSGPGYDLVTGNGVPLPSKLLAGIQGSNPPSPPPVASPPPPPVSPPPVAAPPPAPTPPAPLPFPIAVLEQLADELLTEILADIAADATGNAFLSLGLWALRQRPALKASTRKRLAAKIVQASIAKAA